MLMRTLQVVIFACGLLGTLSGAEDPFVGIWKLNQSKSKMTGEREKIEALGGKEYKITSGPSSDTIVADGTDPACFAENAERAGCEGGDVREVARVSNG